MKKIIFCVIFMSLFFGISYADEVIPMKEVFKNKDFSISVFAGDGWAMYLPGEWRDLTDKKNKNMIFFIEGSGKGGILPFDGSLEPLQTGIVAEIIKSSDYKKTAKEDIKEIVKSKQRLVRDKVASEEIILKDGAKALCVGIKTIKLDANRLSQYKKVYLQLAPEKVLVVSAYVVTSRGSEIFAKRFGINGVLDSCLMSVVKDKSKLDITEIKSSLSSLDKNFYEGGKYLFEARELMGKDDAAAVKLLIKSIDACDYITEAYNCLAWIYLTSENKELLNRSKGLKFAVIGAEVSSYESTAMLDTLAVAYLKNGKKTDAKTTIEKALLIKPDDKQLKERLDEVKNSKEEVNGEEKDSEALGKMDDDSTPESFGYMYEKGLAYATNVNENSYSFFIEGKDITAKDYENGHIIMFSVGGILIQYTEIPINLFYKDNPEKVDDKSILSIHEKWETEYQAKTLNAKLSVEQKFLTAKNGKFFSIWSYHMPEKNGTENITKQYITTVRSGNSVVVFNIPATETGKDDFYYEILKSIIDSLKMSGEPITLKMLKEIYR